MLIGWLQNSACTAALFPGIQLLLDVLRGLILTHSAGRRLPIGELYHEMVSSDWLVHSSCINSHLRRG